MVGPVRAGLDGRLRIISTRSPAVSSALATIECFYHALLHTILSPSTCVCYFTGESIKAHPVLATLMR
jgi:hypothetical protein